jgi:hypothetical protein
MGQYMIRFPLLTLIKGPNQHQHHLHHYEEQLLLLPDPCGHFIQLKAHLQLNHLLQL